MSYMRFTEAVHGSDKEKPIVSMDYAFLGIQKGKDKDEQMKLEDEAATAATERDRFCRDFVTKYRAARASKGQFHPG